MTEVDIVFLEVKLNISFFILLVLEAIFGSPLTSFKL